MLKSVNNSIVCSRSTKASDVNRYDLSICKTGFFFQNATNSCLQCNFPNCLMCSGYQVCSQCNNGYYLWNVTYYNSQNNVAVNITCLPCVSNCSTCSSFYNCSNCTAGYYQFDNNCLMCSMQFCSSCSNATTCTMCNNGTYLSQTNSSECLLCNLQIPNCVDCTESSPSQLQCSTCSYGYYVNGSNCSKCPSNCQSCG